MTDVWEDDERLIRWQKNDKTNKGWVDKIDKTSWQKLQMLDKIK